MQTGDRSANAAVVVTGMGLATGLGLDVDSTWVGIREGRIGLGPMDAMESVLPDGAIGGQAIELPADFASGLPREVRYLRWVIAQALRNANAIALTEKEPRASASGPPTRLRSGFLLPERRAIVLGTTLHGIRAGGRFLRNDDPGALKHFLANSVTRLAIEGLDIEGLSVTTCSACSSSLGAIALGVTMLETGQADLVIAGGYDAVSEYVWAGFNSLRLVAPKAVMPFAKHRHGMVPTEGYGVLVLERSADAKKRGAKALATVQGWGESADAHHLTQPEPKGTGATRAMREAMARANLQPSDISMIAAHATATLDNDAAEYAGFHAVLGDALVHTPVVGFKSYLGHTLGGAGAVELILSACALRAGWVPPCATVRQEDVEFAGLSVAPPGGLEKPITRTLNTSLGFGGANTCVILGRGEEADQQWTGRPARQNDRPGETPGPLIDSPASHDGHSHDAIREAWITGYGLVLPGMSDATTLLDKLTHSDGVVVPRSGGAAITVIDEQLSQILNIRRMRRLSTCVKLMLASVSLAIRHAGLEGDAERLALASAMLATMHGSPGFCSEYYTQIVREGVLGANPVLFAEGVPNAGAAHVSANFGIRGACQTIIGSRTAGLDALGLAAMRIRSGASDTIIVGASEETHACVDLAYRHFNLLRSENASADGDGGGEEGGEGGFFTTPGAVAFVVESSVSAMARSAKPLAKIGRYAGVSVSRPVVEGASCFGEFDSPSRVLNQLQAEGAVLGSGNRTWIDRAEALAVRRLAGAALVESLHHCVGELFAAGPLLGIVRAIAEGVLPRMTSLCSDFTGTAAAIEIERIA